MPAEEFRALTNQQVADMLGLVETFDQSAVGGSGSIAAMKPQRAAWGDFPDVVIAAPESAVKQHPSYVEAKAGDAGAAIQLVRDVLSDDVVNAVETIGEAMRPVLVSAHAEEETGRNAIPQAFAAVLGQKLDWPVDNGIVQINIVNHTGSDGFSRLARPALFDGEVESREYYLLVDDFIGQGGTLANMRGYIEANGGKVVGAVALTGKPYSAKLALSEERQAALRQKHGQLESWWREKFGYGFDALTESEARYLERTSDADKIRDRIAASEQSANPEGGSGNGDESQLNPTGEQNSSQQTTQTPPTGGVSAPGPRTLFQR